jgi:hypothetical protein
MNQGYRSSIEDAKRKWADLVQPNNLFSFK